MEQTIPIAFCFILYFCFPSIAIEHKGKYAIIEGKISNHVNLQSQKSNFLRGLCTSFSLSLPLLNTLSYGLPWMEETPWSRVLEKVITQLLRNFLKFYGTWKFTATFTRALSSARLLLLPLSHFSKIYFYVMLPLICRGKFHVQVLDIYYLPKDSVCLCRIS
jgi:hypothetical protein